MLSSTWNPPSSLPWANLFSSISFPWLIFAFFKASSSAIVNFFAGGAPGPGPPGPNQKDVRP